MLRAPVDGYVRPGMRTSSGWIALAVAAALVAAPAAAAAVPGAYEGKLYSSEGTGAVKGSKVTFKVRSGKVRNFRAKGGTSTCLSIIGGTRLTFYPLSFEVPSAAIRNNRIDKRYVVRRDGEKLATNTLKGRFDGRRVSGTLAQDGPSSCAADYRWRARRV